MHGDLCMSIGERIIELRKAENLSQGQLASMLDVSRQAVSKWENDLSSPDTLRLIQLANILKTDVEYLATGKSSEPVIEKVIVKVPEIHEKVVERIVEKPVVRVVEKIVETPVIKRVFRVKYFRNPIEYIAVGLIAFAAGIVFGRIMG